MKTIKHALPVLLTFFLYIPAQSFTSRLAREWRQVEQLQEMLNDQFGQEKPFSEYASTHYNLFILLQRMQQDYSVHHSTELRAILEKTGKLTTQLESTSQKLFYFFTHPQETESISQAVIQEPKTQEESLDHNNDIVLLEFLTMLQYVQKHINTHGRNYALSGTSFSNGVPSQPYQLTPPNPYINQPPAYPGYPPYPYPLPAQDQNETMMTLLKVGVIGGIILIAYSILKFQGTEQVQKDIGKLGRRVAKNDARHDIKDLNTQKFVDLEKR